MSDRTIISFDYAIKYLMRDPSNFTILDGFLSELLGRDVNVLGILESESNKRRKEEKINRIDLKAKIDGGELAVFEIQYRNQADFFGKVLFDVCKAVVEQVPSGGKYNVKKVYSINIAYYDVGAERDYLFTAKISGFKGVHYDETVSFALTYGRSKPPKPKTDIHPEYFLLLPNKFDEEIREKFDEWMYTLKNSAVKSSFTAKGLKEAAEKLDVLKMSPEEQRDYDRYMRNKANEDSIIETAIDDGWVEGHAAGEAKGLAKGLAEGEAKGETKGRQEALLEVAKNLKAAGMGADGIAKATGLTPDEIGRL